MISINFRDRRAIYEQIMDGIIECISLGIFKPDEKIPSVRKLAVDINVNPATVQKAYSELEKLGYIYTVKGRGNFASSVEHYRDEQKSNAIRQIEDTLDAVKIALNKEEVYSCIDNYYERIEK